MTQDLLEKPQAGQQPVQLSGYTGAIIGLQGDVLQGWAMDTAQPETRPVVEVFIDGASVAFARADQYEPLAPVGDDFHGFTIQLRKSWLQEARLITARVANHTIDLEGMVQLPAGPSLEPSAIASQVWHTGGLRVGGWSWDPQSPRRHVEVTVREGNRVICTATCNVHNQALAYRDTSDHGFAIDLPWELADGKVHVLDIVDDHGQSLAGSPIHLCCWPEGVEGLIQKLDKTQDPATMALLTAVASDQTLRLPKSAGWHLYPQWFEAFQRLEGLEAPTLQCNVGVLIISAGDSELEQITVDSIGADQCHIHHLATASPSDLSESLQKLLDAGCDRILPMAAGDRLAPKALLYLAALLDDGSAWGFADCDQDGPQDQRTMPWLKPMWDIDFFIGADIYSPGSIFTRMVVEKALTLSVPSTKRSNLSWYSFLAGIAYVTELHKLTVSHLPRIIYHRRRETKERHDLTELSPERRQSVGWLCEKLAPGARVSDLKDYPALTRAHWPLPTVLPRVSLIVPTRDQFKLLYNCIEGLLENTDYPNIELIIVDNQSSDLQTLEYLDGLPQRGVKVIDYPHPFNYSTINNYAAQHATGEIIGLINNDIEIIDSSWLKEMVSQLTRPGMGAVGAKLLWPNGMVQHGGVIVGINGLAAHSGNNLSEDDAGYLWTNLLTRQQSAVTAACLLLRKSIFDDLQGLDGSAFPVAFNDVDLCLRIREQGYKVVWTANARLTHAESASRGKDLAPEKRSRAYREQINFMTKWTAQGQQDPYYHPAISTDYLSGPYGGLAIPMRSVRPRSNNQHT